MNDGQDRTENLALLERTLDVFGSDPGRWPEDVRHRLAGFIARDASAQERLVSERAFERVLQAHPATEPQRLARLADQIVAKVETSLAPSESRGAEIIAWPGPRRRQSDKMAPVRISRKPGGLGSAAALLAASLLVGVFAGSTDAIRPFAQRVADNIGLAADIDPVEATVVDDMPELNEWEVQ